MLHGPHYEPFRDATREIDRKMAQLDQDSRHQQLALYAARRACDATPPHLMAEVAAQVYRGVLDGLSKPASQDGA